jgi:hypothetical protein
LIIKRALTIPTLLTSSMPDGKPELSGYWAGGSFDPGVAEFQDWVAELARRRRADDYWSGHSQTEMLHVVERYRRPDLGHLELEMTVEDRSALKAPWLIKRTYILDPKKDILENVCAENEKDWSHLAYFCGMPVRVFRGSALASVSRCRFP